MKEDLLKNAKSLEALSLKDSGFNYFLALETAECGFDEVNDRYALMQVGWDRGRRVRGNLIYVTLGEGKVWIEYDGMERGITQDLVDAGISQERIVFAFQVNLPTAVTM